jgi:tetratricopeptide (TPR) repeat protein
MHYYAMRKPKAARLRRAAKFNGVNTMISHIVRVAVAFSMIVVVGCQSARPIETIRASGDYKMRQGDYGGAADEYGEIISRYPGDWKAQYEYGLCMLELKQYAAARRAMEIAYNAKPNDVDVAMGLAEAMFRQGDESRLFAFLKQRAAEQQTIEAYLALAKYSLDMNDPDTARVALETAIVIDDGQSTEPYLQSAALAERLGNLDEAIRRLRQAYGINPDDRRVTMMMVTLGETPGPAQALPPGR